jgi:hypothetical protein
MQPSADKVAPVLPTRRSHLIIWTLPMAATLVVTTLTTTAHLTVSTGVLRVAATAFISLALSAQLARPQRAAGNESVW